jgi:two-component system nitrogen regulation response regulator NtrX
MDLLIRHRWPGNVRELKNIIERLVIMTQDSLIRPQDIPPAVRSETGSDDHADLFKVDSLKDAKDAFERTYLAYKLAQFNDNISRTAESIGIERSHLHRKIKSLGISLRKESSS